MGDEGTERSVREVVESTVLKRAFHEDKDKVGDTRSFANMEQTLTREYWGRFLIEMLQNARDAWLADGRGGSDGVLRIRLTGDPALVVCNEGTPLTSSIVLDSIAKFGESPKKPGEGIGHKGIGFKAVLELTRSPRIYSRTDASGSFDLSVYFDPDEARRMLMAHSPRWNELVAQLASASGDPDGGDRIPILRFPLWDDDPPTWLDDVAILDGRAFNTVIALPYDTRFDGALGLTRDDFCERVRTAFRELSDEVVLLLGVFARIVIEDEAQRPPLEISRTERALETQVDGATLHEVEIGRDGSHPSRWWLFRRSLPEASGIAGDLAVAIHLEDGEDGRQRPVTPQDGLAASGAAECFHLFFPTRIRTHLPFLLHAYFEVDAGRKGFAEDRAGENQGRLDGLRRLVVDAMTHMSKQVDAVDLEPLPALFAATAGTPEDGLAHKFRDDVLRDLDRTPWVLTRLGSIVSPRDLLVDEQADAHRVLPHAFPDQYVARRIGRSYPLIEKAPALEFLAHRAAIAHGAPTAGLGGAMLVELLHPGPGDVIWDADPDVGFQKILELLDIVKRRDSVAAALETVRSDTSAVFIPVVDGVDERRLRAPGHDTVVLDDEDDPVPVGAILARVTASRETSLVPPRSLGLDFLRDGLLDAEQLAGVGAKLGIRPYLTEVIIDALARAGAKVDEREALPFVWRLLLRERGKYSIINVLRTSAKFEPGSWYWSKADGNTTDGRENRRRARALANLPLPTRHSESEWRPAGELAFGRDWADWLDAHAASLGVASVARADAYRDLERAADPSCMIASPSILAGLLPLSADDIAWAGTEAAPDLPDDDGTRHLLLIHAFLLRLGVWEIPPVKGFVNYRHPRRVEGPPWATEDGWQRLRAAHAAAGGPFGQFGHANVYLSEDFSLAWSLTSDPALIRSLARGADFYKAYRKAELFCPQCSGEGSRWHQRRYSSDGDPRFLSYLAWQLAEEPWVPASTWGSPSVVSRARDTWLPDERPDDARMQQSWMRFLPIASQDVAPALASLAGVRRLAEADASRIEGLLRTLQGRFEAGEVDPERRAGSLASQTFIGLHWRLYEQLANLDAAIAREVLDRVGVLAVHGRALVYRPRSEVRHDDGADSSFRRYFAGRVAFSILPRDLGPVADALEIERFRVGVERVQGGKETDVTVDVRPFIHERAAELLALQVFHPLGTKALQLDGREFPVRAERLRTLNVVRVNDLVLRLSVPTLHLDKEIGADFNEDLYLDDRSSPPTLYLDLSGSRWADRLRALAGPYLAMLLENNAYGATFQLLLQAETEVEVESFLEERSVSPEDVELVRSQIDVVAGVVRNEERRWWRAVLPLLGSTSPDELDGDAYRRTLKERVEARAMGSPVPGLAQRLLRAGGGDTVRHDGSADGALASLEEHGIALLQLHEMLVSDGDSGLTVRVAAQRLAEWRRLHEREVVAILVTRGMDPGVAKRIPDAWQVGPDAVLKVHPEPADYLESVVSDLHYVGLDTEAALLASPGGSAYLADLVSLSPEQLSQIWHGLFDDAEKARQARDRAFAWRRVLRPVLVCARTHAGEPSHAIRSEAIVVDGLLPVAPETPDDIVGALAAIVGGNEELVAYLAGRVREGSLSDPSLTELRPDLDALLDGHHLDQVVSVLQRGRRQLVDRVRQDLAAVREQQLKAAPFPGATPPEDGREQEGEGKSKPKAKPVDVRRRRSHDQRTRDRLGIEGERIALAVVLDALQHLPIDEQDRVILELVDLLRSVAKGEIVDRLAAEAKAAMIALDDDDRLECLAKFLHVAQESDDFGFDVLGYLAPFEGTQPQPLLLEVKNSGGRSFPVSTAEWRRADEQGDRYAFLILLRGLMPTLELVPNPSELFRTGQIGRDPDSWAVSYDPLPPTTGATT